jgi:uncharacterized small protein (DUF1192 family)
MLDDEDLPKPPPRRLSPLPLDALGIAELRAYIAELQGEITRVEAEISRKERHREAVEGLFKKTL